MDAYSTFLSTLLPHERLAATREERAILHFQRRQADWDAQREHLSQLVGLAPADLVVSHGEQWRQRQEQRDAAERSQPPSENCNRAAQEWEM